MKQLMYKVYKHYKTIAYQYLSFSIIFIVVYSPILAPILIQVALFKDIHSPYAYVV